MRLRGGSSDTSHRGDPIDHPVAAGAAAFAVSALFFVGSAALVPVRENVGLMVVWALICLAGVVVVARRFGPRYSVPLAIAVGLAFDSFYIPPIRDFGSDYWQNWVAMATYLGLGVVVGGLAAGARRRAEVSDSARQELEGEQAALRRVATLVARRAPPPVVFASVAEEVGGLFAAESAEVVRHDASGDGEVVGVWSRDGRTKGSSVPRRLEGLDHIGPTPETGWSAPVDGYGAHNAKEATAVTGDSSTSSVGTSSVVGAPIVVHGRIWGALRLARAGGPGRPADIELRLAKFTDLAATAIANAEAQAELTASRVRIVASADETRRRIERDLHDGTQQRLVSLALRLRMAQSQISIDDNVVAAELEGVIAGIDDTLEELREFARGVHPGILAKGGLGPALRTLARRSAVPVDLNLSLDDPLPEPVEVGAYFVVSEALANATKHAQASHVAVDVEEANGLLRLRISDDGIGGASFDSGSGLVGLKDRLEALGGTFDLRSESGIGTSIAVEVPLHNTPRY